MLHTAQIYLNTVFIWNKTHYALQNHSHMWFKNRSRSDFWSSLNSQWDFVFLVQDMTCSFLSFLMTATLIVLITMATDVDKSDIGISIWTNASDSFTHNISMRTLVAVWTWSACFNYVSVRLSAGFFLQLSYLSVNVSVLQVSVFTSVWLKRPWKMPLASS